MTVTLIATRQDMSRWTRAHIDAPTVNWSVQAGPGGTMIIIEDEADRPALVGTGATTGQCEVPA